MKPCRLFFTSLLAITVSAAQAQGGRDNAGGLTLPVGQTSAVQTATLTFTTATTPGTPFSINVLTQGSPNLDFNLALNNSVPAGTCSATATYAVGDTCTVNYTFSPHFPGIRHGGISLTIGTTPLANTYLNGTGLGPQAALAPPTQLLLGGDLGSPNEEFAIEGAGNIYTGFFFAAFQTGGLFEIPAGCTSQDCVNPLTYFGDFGGAAPNAVTIDGSGNLYISFYGTSIFGPAAGQSVFEFPRGCYLYACAKQLGGEIIEPWAIQVDPTGSGNVYVTGAYKGTLTSQNNDYVIEIPPGCASVNCIVPISEPYADPLYYLAIDNKGNLFFGGTSPASNPSSGGTYEIPAGCKSSSCTVTFAGIGGGSSTTATDSPGNLYVAGMGGYMYGTTTYEFPLGCMDSSCALTVPPDTYQWYLPRGQLFNGNIYRINDGGYAVLEYDPTDPATVTFPATVQGQVSPVQTVTLTNEGNEPLAFAPSTTQQEPTISQYFQLDTASSGTCGAIIATSTAPTLAANASCTFPLDFAPLAPALGTITGTSTFVDNTLNVPGTTQTIPLVGTAALPGSTYLILTASINPVYAGVATTFTAQLSSPSGTPTGSVTFSDGATLLATVPVTAGTTGTASATFTTSTLTVGSHTITAVFTPTGIYLASNASLSVIVYRDVAEAVLTATPNPANLGAPVSLSVALSGDPVGPTPTGTITFTDNGTSLATVPIVNGTAVFSTTTLPGGANALACNYSGDANYAADNCPIVNETINTPTTATAITLVPSANPASPFSALTFTGTLTTGGAPLSGIPVALTINGMLFSTKTTNALGKVTFPTQQSSLGPGQYTVTATSAASGIYISSTATLTEIVSTAPTTTALQSSLVTGPTGITTGTFTATVSGSLTDPNNGPLTPTGSVTFSINGVALATVPLNGTTAVYTSSTLPVGSDAATCAYSGDINFAPSPCNTAQFIIQPPTPPDFTVTLAPPALTVPTGQSASTQVMLRSIAGFNGTVTLTCGKPLPPLLSCTFDQTQLNLSANGNASTRLVLKTDAIAANRPPDFWPESSRRIQLAALLPLSLLGLLGPSRRRRRNGLFRLLVLTVCLTAGTVSGCGGGYASFTPPGTYSIPVTASTSTTTHSATLSLSVVP